MAPAQHIEWLTDNMNWFCDLSVSSLDADVPACPGWNVENVITHLGFGLGLAYPYALRSAPGCPDSEVFDDVPWPTQLPTGQQAFTEFERTMGDCIDAFMQTDPATPCYTYEGPGVAAFWFRRAAIETTVHRMDVVEALEIVDSELSEERANDAVAEAVEFALPLAARLSGASILPVSVRVNSGSSRVQLGTGTVAAEITGDATSVLAALWGRSRSGIQIEGDLAAASQWMSLVEKAFAGR